MNLIFKKCHFNLPFVNFSKKGDVYIITPSLNLCGVHLTQLFFMQYNDLVFHIAQAIRNKLVCFVGLKLNKPYLSFLLLHLITKIVMKFYLRSLLQLNECISNINNKSNNKTKNKDKNKNANNNNMHRIRNKYK